jgi:DNA-binding FadR family transcriptional regulator
MHIMLNTKLDSDFLDYIIRRGFKSGDRLPSIEELSAELRISVGKLREQLEVARCLGMVEVRPRAGIRLAETNFLPSVRLGVLYALARDPSQFEAFGLLRNHIEASFWHEAVALLTPEDRLRLQALVEQAWAKLNGKPIQIPHSEHRNLHLTIFSRLENPFVKGLLEAYWEAYEAVGLNLYADYQFLRDVWTYHARIVTALAQGDVDESYRLFVEHSGLLRYLVSPRAKAASDQWSASDQWPAPDQSSVSDQQAATPVTPATSATSALA